MLVLGDVNLVAVVGTACFMLASATIWFSPELFGQQTKAKQEDSNNLRFGFNHPLIRELLVLGVIYVLFLYLLALVVLVVARESLDFWSSSFVIATLVTSSVAATNWHQTNLSKTIIANAVFYFYFVVVGFFMLKHWPW